MKKLLSSSKRPHLTVGSTSSPMLAARRMVPALLLASAMLLGCSDDKTGADNTVEVKLGEFYIKATPEALPAGTIKFHVINEGPDDVHEMVVLKTDLAPKDLPLDKNGDVDEEADGVEVMGEVEHLAAEGSEDLSLQLAPGKYFLICNIAQTEPDNSVEHHFALGMYTTFSVE